MVLDARARFVKVRTLTLIALSVGVLGVVVSVGGEWGHVNALDPIAQVGALMMIVGFVSLPPLTISIAMCDARWRREVSGTAEDASSRPGEPLHD